jgi:hypothetical protein
MHYPDMRKAFNRLLAVDPDGNGVIPTNSGDPNLENLAKIFEERVNEAREIVLAWN